MRPISIVTFTCLSESLLLIDTKPGAGSMRTIAQGPSRECRPMISHVRASWRVSCLSFGIKQEAVKDVEHSHRTRID